MELLDNSRQQVLYLDSLQDAQQAEIDNLREQVNLNLTNYELSKLKADGYSDLIDEYQVKLEREHRRKRTWRTFFFIAGGLFAGYAAYHSIR